LALTGECTPKLLGAMTETLVGGEERQRRRIVDRGLRSRSSRCQRITALMSDRAKMIDVAAVWRDPGHEDILDFIEAESRSIEGQASERIYIYIYINKRSFS
jgi:hypothetical protein